MRNLNTEETQKITGGNGLPFPFIPAPIGPVILLDFIMEDVLDMIGTNNQQQTTSNNGSNLA